MRYQNWDVLVFPEQCKIPLQEFKTTCHVIQDPEPHSSQNNPHFLPTLTCFIPGLPAGAPFRISIHSWQTPDISRYIQNMRKPSDQIMFEARLFIDGRIAGSKWFNQDAQWPTIIDLSIDLDKQGDFEKLKFPAFHKEILSQSYWNAGDDLGRVKVLIAEGFSRDNPNYPFERVKNVVSFSFQHAPLDVLEASAIAWPNAAMWRQASLVGPYFPQQMSPRQTCDGVEAHSHSPRHPAMSTRPFVPPGFGSVQPPTVPVFPRQPTFDPFTEAGQPSFTSGWRHASSGDVSMPDYSNSSTRANSSRHVTDPMLVCERPEPRFNSMQMAGAFEYTCDALTSMPSAPVNTLQNGEDTPGVSTAVRNVSTKVTMEPITTKADVDERDPKPVPLLSTTITSNVKSRKENGQSSPRGADLNSTGYEGVARKVSQQFSTTAVNGIKRPRVVTPAASKVIDDEDEPRTSPSLRMASRGSAKQEGKEVERRVLSGIENVN